jgi:segregation and condensation protein B
MNNANEGSFGTADDLAHCYERVMEENLVPDAGSPTATARTETLVDSVAPPPLRRIVEALLFVGGAPLTFARAAETVRGLTAEQFREILDGLNRDYRQQGRPYRIQMREQGCELVLQPRFRGVLDRLYGSTREARLSPAALDVLALVAYRQPIARQEVEALRGADSAGALRQLVRLGLIAVQRGEADQREVTYSTTSRFLTLFQLRSLDDLPRTQDLQRL